MFLISKCEDISVVNVIFLNLIGPVHENGFQVGMRLEGIDPRHPSVFCVLTVAQVRDGIVLSWDNFTVTAKNSRE